MNFIKMNSKLILKIPILLLLLTSGMADAQKGPVSVWNFEDIQKNERITPQGVNWWEKPEQVITNTVTDDISGETGMIHGNYFKLVSGISGKALLLDGITSFVESSCEEASCQEITEDFSVGAWIALGAYPANWCPVVYHNTISAKGYFLGIDAFGHAGFKLFAGGQFYEIQSEERIPLRKWIHIEGVYSLLGGMALYIDGKEVASGKVNGEFEPAIGADIIIGKYYIKQKPEGTIRPRATEAEYTYFDGIIDELTIYNRSQSGEEISNYVKQISPTADPALQARSLPKGPTGMSEFGAIIYYP